jgi:RND family efflux transporter MFP subunit
MTRSRILALRAGLLCGAWGLLIGVLGCKSKEQEKAELPPPVVTVAPPVERMVTQYEYVTGRFVPIDQVTVRARVTGELKKIDFQPGHEVRGPQKRAESDKGWFKLTEQTFRELRRAKVPDAVLTKLQPLQDKELSREEAQKEIAGALGAEDAKRFQDNIVKLAGDRVIEGEKLFQIDPAQFEADVAKAKASLETAKAELKVAEAMVSVSLAKEDTTKKSYNRQQASFMMGGGSEAERDIAKGLYDEAAAAVLAAKAKVVLSAAQVLASDAALESAELNLGYCTIRAEISGIVGDRLKTEGNLITQNTTDLTTIVRADKLDAAVDVDEATLRRLREAAREGKIQLPKSGHFPAEAGLGGPESGYPLKGYIDFTNNQVDQKTGTIRMKARFDNTKPEAGPRELVAGMYVRTRAPIGAPVRSMLVPESAFGSDQGTKYLYLLGPENKAVRMDAQLGVQDGEMRVVESVEVPGSGKARPLSPDDKVIISGIQRVRPGMVVDPKPPKK